MDSWKTICWAGSGDELGEVAVVDVIPVGPSRVVESQAEGEGLQTELGGLEGDPRRVARTGEIPHGFVLEGRNVDRREVSRAEQACGLDRVFAVVLHLVAWFFRDPGGCGDPAGEPLAGEVSVQDVPARAGFLGVDERKALA